MIVRENTGDWETYTPEYQGNRDATEPMTIEVCGMTAAEWSKHKLTDGDAIVKGSFTGAEQRVRAVLRERLRNPQRFYVQRHDELEPRLVDDVKEFLLFCPDALASELYQAIVNATRLEGGLKKKSS